jgi:hypothetical protein
MNYVQLVEKFLVENYKDAPKWLSMWILVLVGCAPELYDLAVQYKMLEGGAPLPAVFAKALNMIGFLGAAARIVNQAAIAKGLAGLLPGQKADPTDQAGA